MKENNKKSTDISSDDVSGHFKIGNSNKKICVWFSREKV